MSELLSFFVSHGALSLLFILLFFYLIALETRSRIAKIHAITPLDAVQALNHKQAHVIDLREKTLFIESHIIGAEHAHPFNADKLAKKCHHAKTHPVILCGLAQDKTLASAVGALRQAGFQEVRILEGGMQAWIASGLPTVKGAS